MSSRSTIPTAFLACAVACAIAWAAVPTDDSAPLATRPGVLVFRSGRVIEGDIAETETHYVVVRPVGKIEVPKSQVETVTKDLDAAYRLKASRINDRDPDEHVKLAQWCLLVDLRERAIQELERAANLSGDPNRVKGMLDALRRTTATSDKPKPKQVLAETIEPRGPAAMPARQPTEKDVTPAAVSTFTLQIQPMLTRSCATAGCHDTSHTGPLGLARSSLPSPRNTQSNLRVVLAMIDADDPDRSPLVALAARPHPRDGRRDTSNPLKDAAFANLVDWTRTVAGRPAPPVQKLPPPSDAASEPGTNATDTSLPAVDPVNRPNGGQSATTGSDSLMLTPARPKPGMSGASRVPADPSAVFGPRSPASGSVAEPLKLTSGPGRAGDDYKPVDPFDPEIFNRQFAPNAAGQRP